MKKLLLLISLFSSLSYADKHVPIIFGPGHAILLQNSLCLLDGVTCLIVGTSQTPAALAVDWTTGNVFKKTISTNSTFTFANSADGQTIVVAITDSNSSTVTWPTVTWSGGTPPTQTASKTDIYTFIKIGSTIYGSVVQNF